MTSGVPTPESELLKAQISARLEAGACTEAGDKTEWIFGNSLPSHAMYVYIGKEKTAPSSDGAGAPDDVDGAAGARKDTYVFAVGKAWYLFGIDRISRFISGWVVVSRSRTRSLKANDFVEEESRAC